MPTINKLTDSQCRAAKPGPKGRKLFDGGGLHLYISPSGAKTWRLAYRLESKPKTISFGPYPQVSLAQAREHRDLTKASLRAGIDPMEQKRPRQTRDIAFGQAIDRYWGSRQDVSDGYRDNATRALKRHLAALARRSMREITREDLLQAFNVMNANGLYVYVRKTRMWAEQVFEWAVEQGLADANPVQTINPKRAFGAATVVNFVALAQPEIPDFLARLEMERALNSVIACKLLALTWVRTRELRSMTFDQISDGTWYVPAENMKSRLVHIVPLSRQALALIETMRERSRGSCYVFPHEYRLDRPMSENAILYLIYRIGYKGRMTGHGWRSVASTWANERGYNADAIELQLAHAPADKTRAAYNRAAYLPQRTQLLQDWADWLDSCHPMGSLVAGK